jgi:hypothetical protein
LHVLYKKTGIKPQVNILQSTLSEPELDFMQHLDFGNAKKVNECNWVKKIWLMLF